MVVAIGAAVWLSWLLVKVLWPVARQWWAQFQAVSPVPGQPQEPLGVNPWLQRSRQYQKQGNYREACRALYLAMLEYLHETQQVPRQLSRTDGAYRLSVEGLSQSQPCLLLINIHEQLCFDDRHVSAETFERCQRAYQTLEKISSPG
jgi:hypothetical protein